ncbi:hypothetical protein N9948_01015 [bacterium]|nr:hypothetical protein [bacterium]
MSNINPKYQPFFENFKYMLEFGSLKWHLKEIWSDKWAMHINKKDEKYFGFMFFYYDGCHYSFGLWYLNIYAINKMYLQELQEPTANSLQFIQQNTIITKIKMFLKRTFKR